MSSSSDSGMMLTQANVIHAGSFALGLGLLDMINPAQKLIEGPSKAKGSGLSSPVAKTAGTAFAASLINQYFLIPGQLPDFAGTIPNVSKLSVGDGLSFAILQAVRSQKQRSLKRGIYNLLVGGAVSAITSKWIDPNIGAYLPGGLYTTNQSSNQGTTTPGANHGQ